ncbi:MAG: hypothetical protein BWK80_04585 [Desulfobacteraceae bacterium IS3]|nr:MAG: hypothetical protein BWK80_04585 [Desulfobacteraceae bacterium IS3]
MKTLTPGKTCPASVSLQCLLIELFVFYYSYLRFRLMTQDLKFYFASLTFRCYFRMPGLKTESVSAGPFY